MELTWSSFVWGHGRTFSEGRMTSVFSTEALGESSENQNQIRKKPPHLRDMGE